MFQRKDVDSQYPPASPKKTKNQKAWLVSIQRADWSAESPAARALFSKKPWVPKKDEISSNASPWQFKPGNNHPTSSPGIHLQKVSALQRASLRRTKQTLLYRECILSSQGEVNLEPEGEGLPNVEQVCRIWGWVTLQAWARQELQYQDQAKH